MLVRIGVRGLDLRAKEMTITRTSCDSVAPDYNRKLGVLDVALLAVALPITCVVWLAVVAVAGAVNILTLRIK